MLIFVVIFLSMIPSSFKQYPVDGKPIIEITPKAITINGEAKKISDILEVRLTITLAPVGNKEENEKYVDSLLDKEPEKHMTGNVDFAVKAIGKKGETTKTLFTTVADSYEALVALYQAGVKHYSIVYSLKKISKTSRYNLGEAVTEDGVKLSELSKKDRMKQLFWNKKSPKIKRLQIYPKDRTATFFILHLTGFYNAGYNQLKIIIQTVVNGWDAIV